MIVNNSKIIGGLIKEYRLKRGLSRYRFAKEVKCTTDFLKRVEEEKTTISDLHLRKFVQYLEIPKEVFQQAELLRVRVFIDELYPNLKKDAA